jgi:hypothetical protein
MTTCALIKEKLEAGEWSALDAAHGMILSALDRPSVEGVSLRLDDPEFWSLGAMLVERAGEEAIKVAKLLAIVVALLK